MLLEFELVKGVNQNLLIDSNLERIHFLPKNMNNLRSILVEFLDYPIKECLILDNNYKSPNWVEVIEAEFNSSTFEDLILLSEKLISEFLILHINNSEDISQIIKLINKFKLSGKLLLHQIILVGDFENKILEIPENNSLIVLVSKNNLIKKREVKLNNFIINKSTILNSDRINNFYFGRIYVDKLGLVKSHFESTYNNVSVKDCPSVNDILSNNIILQNWFLSKNKITTCKKCEFRKICFDSSIPVTTIFGDFRRNTPCNYDPYTNTWA